jgi:hypothetical protein
MRFDQPDKWMMINDLLAKGNLQLIDIQAQGPVESSIIAIIYILLREL